MIALLLLALAASQALSIWFFFDERRMAVRAAARGHIFSRTASIVRLLAQTPPHLHGQILGTVSTPRLRFWLSDGAAAKGDAEDEREAHLARRLRAELPSGTAAVFVDVDEEQDSPGGGSRRWRLREQREHGFRAHRPWRRLDEPGPENSQDGPRFPRRLGLAVSVQLPDRQWLNATTTLRTPPLTWAVPSFAAMAVMALALVVIVIVMVRRITRPMHRLAAAADRLGRGEAVEPLREEGPGDVRRTTRAFDRMRERLQRFVQDRTRMLAAVSHDLRTPLTALRLRAEFIEDSETRERLLATIDEMTAMVEAALAFAREEAAQEDTRTVDLAALIESVCVDFADLGKDVAFAPGERMAYACRPIGLKRAIRNVVENAVRYAGGATVAIARTEAAYRVTVEDDGPGIPETDLDRVFEPFMRLEESRNKESGGIGLGLSIVRSIVQSHGGEVTLRNRKEGGLRVTITLPLD
jgi:signal transduction histidine kinase